MSSPSAGTPAGSSAWPSAATAARSSPGSIDCTARIWSAEPPATELDQVRRRAAVDLVQSLFETLMLKPDVLGALRTDRSLDEPLRAAALEIAGRRSEDAQALFEAAWLTILRPSGQADLYAQAVRRLEAACELVTGDPERLVEYQSRPGPGPLPRRPARRRIEGARPRRRCAGHPHRPRRPRHGQSEARPSRRSPRRPRSAPFPGQVRPGRPRLASRRIPERGGGGSRQVGSRQWQ